MSGGCGSSGTFGTSSSSGTGSSTNGGGGSGTDSSGGGSRPSFTSSDSTTGSVVAGCLPVFCTSRSSTKTG